MPPSRWDEEMSASKRLGSGKIMLLICVESDFEEAATAFGETAKHTVAEFSKTYGVRVTIEDVKFQWSATEVAVTKQYLALKKRGETFEEYFHRITEAEAIHVALVAKGLRVLPIDVFDSYARFDDETPLEE